GGFRDDRVVLRTTGLEQLGHTRQTAGDVLGLGALERDTREDVAGRYLVARLDRDDGVHREEIPGIAAALDLRHRTLAGDGDGRLQVLAALAGAPVGDETLGEARRFVGGFRHRRTVDQVLERHFAVDFGQHRAGVGIPLGDTLATPHFVAVIDEKL